jgi:Zn-dependent alcohol dehydrogenase
MTIADASCVRSPRIQNGSRNSAIASSEVRTASGPIAAMNASTAASTATVTSPLVPMAASMPRVMRVRGAVVWEAGAAAPYAESRPVEVAELELAEPGPGELLVRMGAAGLCHSDLSVIDGSRTRALPLALGHEAAGEVVALGEGTTGLEPGDHVVLTFVPPCGSCGPCRSGHDSLCEPAAAAGVAGTLLSGERRVTTADGTMLHHHSGVSAFCEHVVVDARSAVRVDPDLPFEIAAVFGCAVLTGVGAAVYAADVRPGERVAVFGLGGVGLSAVMGAVMAGAEVIAVDLLQGKLGRAERLGATAMLSDGDVVAALREATSGGADKVIDATGRVNGLADAYASTRRGGTTVTVGLPHPEHTLAVPATALVLEERTLRGSYMGNCVPSRDVPRFVEAYREGRLPVDELLTHTIALDEINEGFDRLREGEAVRQAVVF